MSYFKHIIDYITNLEYYYYCIMIDLYWINLNFKMVINDD